MRADSLTIKLEAFDSERALGAWRWLLPNAHHPFAISLFGDWLLESPDGGIHLMDTLEGRVSHLAATRTHFIQAVENDDEVRDEWLLEGLALGQASRGNMLLPGQCYGFKVPPILGAPIEPENICSCEIVSYENFLGEMHEKIRALPPGARIDRMIFGGDP